MPSTPEEIEDDASSADWRGWALVPGTQRAQRAAQPALRQTKRPRCAQAHKQPAQPAGHSARCAVEFVIPEQGAEGAASSCRALRDAHCVARKARQCARAAAARARKAERAAAARQVEERCRARAAAAQRPRWRACKRQRPEEVLAEHFDEDVETMDYDIVDDEMADEQEKCRKICVYPHVTLMAKGGGAAEVADRVRATQAGYGTMYASAWAEEGVGSSDCIDEVAAEAEEAAVLPPRTLRSAIWEVTRARAERNGWARAGTAVAGGVP